MRGEWTKKFKKKAGILLFWLLLWQVAGMLIRNPILFATPLQTAKALWENFRAAGFWQVVGMTLLRIAAGFFLGAILGIVTAALCKAEPFLEELLTPVIALMKTVPVVCFVVLFLVWWGSGFLSVAVSFLMVFTATYFSTLEGLKAVKRSELEMAQAFCLPFLTRLSYVYGPALKPFLLGSFQTTLGLAWKSGVAAEVIGLPARSIGEGLYLAKISLDTAGIFAWTAVTCIFSYLFEKGVLWCLERVFRLRISGKAPEKRTEGPRELGLRGISITLGGKEVLRGRELQIGPGEVYCLTGPSGSGKTTTLRLLAGFLKPDEGELQGCEKGSLCMLFQEDRLCEEATALENVTMVTGDLQKAMDALKPILPEHCLQKPCRELSGGEKRRVALARALAAEGNYLLLDEPFSGLDEETARICREEILRKKGDRTLVIASHVKIE